MLRVIGDVHGQVDFVLRKNRANYLQIIESCGHSLQLGDMGDAETYSVLERHVDPERHRFLAGNHDHYDSLPRHSIGDFGSFELGGVSFFFVRGARSGDKKKLVERGKELGRKLWFEEEELTDERLNLALDAYAASRPRIMMTHASPSRITYFVHDFIREHDPYKLRRNSAPCRTTEMFEQMLDIHRPELWCFGHHHHDWHYHEDGTDFRCVGELCYVDISPDGEITGIGKRA